MKGESIMWIAGTNMPGYMPDNVPEEFETFDEAKRYIISLIKQAEEEAETEGEAETLAAFAEDVNLENSEFSGMCLNWVYWVTEQ